jgi:DNA mismatch repair protein MutS
VKNFSIAVREYNDTIIFLHKLVDGAANRSYGIQVAALAGVPAHVVERAEEILTNIERGEFDQSGQPTIAKSIKQKKKKSRSHPDQLSLFQVPADPLRDYLETIDIDEVTPRKALDLLYHLKGMLN